MVKYKKFLAKAMAMALMAGSLTAVGAAGQPRAIVAEAAATAITIKKDDKAVDISSAISVPQGASFTLVGEATVAEAEDNGVTWTVKSRPTSATGTFTINSTTGKVEVGSDATIGEYVVTATSVQTDTFSVDVKIAVRAEIPITIESVTINADGLDNKKISVEQDSETSFTATVEGAGDTFVANKEEINWSISNPEGAVENKVRWDSTNKKVIVAADATLGVYKLSATSSRDNTKKDEVEITVTAKKASSDLPTINYGSMTMDVSLDDPYITLEVLKKSSDSYKTSNKYVFANPEGYLQIGLGFLKLKDNAYIRVYGSNSTPKTDNSDIMTVNAQPGKLKIKMDTSKATLVEALNATAAKEGNGSVTFTDKDTETDQSGYLENFSYRFEYGTWSEDGKLNSFPYDTAKVSGGIIYIRRDAVEGKAPAGAEVKVKVASAAKAPTVKINYEKETIGLKNSGQAVAILGNTAPTVFLNWTEKDPTPEEILQTCYEASQKEGQAGIFPEGETVENLKAKGFTVVVVTRKSGKADSAPALVSVKSAPVLEANGAVATCNNITATLANGSKEGKVKLTITEGAVFEYKDKRGSWKKATSGKDIDPVDGGLEVRLAGIKESRNNTNPQFPSNGKRLTVVSTPGKTATITIGTEDELATAGTLLIAGANATSALNIPLTITVKDADGNSVTDATKYTVTITKEGSTSAVPGVAYASGNVKFNAVNDSTTAGPALAKDEVYVVTVTYGTGTDAVSESKKFTVAEKKTATITIGTDEELTAAAAKLVAGANATAALEIPLTITVKDAEGTAVTDTTKYTVTITKGTETTAAAGVAFAGGKLTFNAANAEAPTTACPALVKDEKYVVTVMYGTGDDAVTEKKELTVAAAQASNP